MQDYLLGVYLPENITIQPTSPLTTTNGKMIHHLSSSFIHHHHHYHHGDHHTRRPAAPKPSNPPVSALEKYGSGFRTQSPFDPRTDSEKLVLL